MNNDISKKTYQFDEIAAMVKPLMEKYKVDELYLFGSYARGEATGDSDLDFLVYGGDQFKGTTIFALGEELRKLLNKNVDIYEIRKLDESSDFYRTVMKEKVPIT